MWLCFFLFFSEEVENAFYAPCQELLGAPGVWGSPSWWSNLFGQMDGPDPAVQDPYPLNSSLFVFRKPKRNSRGTASRYYFAGEALANFLFLLAVIPYIPQQIGWRFRIGCLLLFLLVIVFFLLHRPVVFFLQHRPVTCMEKESLLFYSLAPRIYHSLLSSLLPFFP